MQTPILFADSERDGTPPPTEELARMAAAASPAIDPRHIDDGQPIALAASVSRLDRHLFEEMATDERASGIPSFSRLHVDGDPHPSKILQTKSKASDRVGELYVRMLETNLDLSGYVDKRIDAVMKLPRQITPADGSPLALETAEHCHQSLGVVKNFAINLRHQLLSAPMGNAFDEIVMEKLSRGPLAGAWVPVDLIDRPMWRFKYVDGVLHVRQGYNKSIPAPLGKFLSMRHGTKDTGWSPGLLDDCYWAWYLSKRGFQFWATYLDKYGMPTALAKYKRAKGGTDPGATGNQQREALALLQLLRSEYGVAIPEDLELDFLEAQRTGSASYETFQAILDRSMAKKILGEVHTSGAGKGPGSFAIGEVANEVRFEKVVLDARNFSAHMRDNLLAPLVLWNYGPDAPVPYWTIDTIDGEDRDQRRKGIAMVLDEGQPVGERHFYQTAQVPIPGEGEKVIVREKPAPVPPPPVAADPGADPNGNPGEPNDPDNPGDAPDPKQTAGAKATEGDGAAVKKAARERGRRVTLAAGDKDIQELRRQAEERNADLDEIATTLANRSLTYHAGWKERLTAAFDSGLDSPTLLRDLVGAADPVANARSLETAQIHGMGVALAHLAEDVGLQALKFEMPPGWDQFQNSPQTALDYWAGQLVIPKSAFLGLSDANRRLAFTVAGVTDLDLLQAIYLLVAEAIANGLSRDQFVTRVEALFRAKGLDPLAKWHAELIYANNVRQAAGLMRYQQLVLNPVAKRLTPYLMWMSLRQHTRPEHLLMHEHIAAIDHEIWRMWWPLAGHNCQCYIASINVAKARRMGLVGAEPVGPWPQYLGAPVLPDEGFRGAPGTVIKTVTDEMQLRALNAVDGAQASGSPDFADAADQLFGSLFGGGENPQTFAAYLTQPAEAA